MISLTRPFGALLLLTSAVLAQEPGTVEREYPNITLVMDRNLEYAKVDGKSLALDLYRGHWNTSASPGLTGAAAEKDAAYRAHQATNPAPVLVWIHGAEGQFDGKYPCPIASMIGNGYTVASIDYRSANDAKSPAALQDCKAAIRWLRANASKYNLDADHVGAWGLSEGGTLAVLLGTTGGTKEFDTTGENTDQSSAVQAVVDFCGPQDSSATPLLNASGSSAPVMIVHGDKDKVVSPAQSQSLDAGLRAKGVNTTLSLVKGAGHDFKELRQSDSAEAVNQFLDQQLKGGEHVRFRLCKIDPPADAWVDPIIDEPALTKYVTFPAHALGPGAEASCLIYLPPNYEKSTSKRYPVLYYFHGANGGQRVADGWVQQLDAAIRNHTVPPMIAVMVEGLPTGSYRDSDDGKRPIESVMIKDLVPYMDATYRTIPKREARALEGLSMGGYGVFHLGFKYPELFGMISGMANGITASGKSYTGGAGRTFTGTEMADSPYTLAERNLDAIRGRMTIRIRVGTDDFTLPANVEWHDYLVKVGIPHDYKVIKGIWHGYKEYYQNLDFSFFKTIATK